MKKELELWENYGPLFSFEERNVFFEDTAELEFYRHLRGRHPGRCLELGAGDGRLAAVLSGRDITVALEPSAAMLDCWSEEDGERVARLRATAQSIPLKMGSIDLALFPYNGLHCILDRVERLEVLRGVSELLAEGGVFVSETCPQFSDREDETDTLRYSFSKGDECLRLVESVSHRFDDGFMGTGRIYFDMTYTGTIAPGGRTRLMLEMALISAGEYLEDLRGSGMSIMSVWGDYDMSPWDGESSPRLLVRAVRSTR
ncbi:MAG: hypothetical protein AVO35_05175 [Candidatus Aegiribacteria sp. MLS_C]|nr:MAG: hypothetical protein AVO35_05175 [Candidatus Aegiribacteria sp. MLS_C]